MGSSMVVCIAWGQDMRQHNHMVLYCTMWYNKVDNL